MISLRRRWLAAGVAGAAVAAAAAIALPRQSGGTAEVAETYQLSAAPLGVNVAPWDSSYTGAGAGVIQPLLSKAGIKQIRYGGGSYADYYDWQTNTSIGGCLPDDTTASFTARCASSDPLDFSQFAQEAREIGAEKFVTVNYGSGTPAEAAAWVTAAARTSGEHVALWEVGNETYSCHEVDNELAGASAHHKGDRPAAASPSGQYQTCTEATKGTAGGTERLAMSYADNALLFLKAMKKADRSAVIGAPWAFGAAVQGSGVADSDEWNSQVLRTDGAYVGFVDAHYYPFSFSGSPGGANPSAAQVLQALHAIPSLQASIKAELAKFDPDAAAVIGETAVSNNQTTTVCGPVGALFAAGDALSWLASGAQSVDWWDLNNDGNTGSSCESPDYGLFTSAAQPVAETPYYGYLLASVLARPGAKLGFMNTSDPGDVLAYQSVLPGGRHAMAFINLDTIAARTVTFASPAGLTGTLSSSVYSAGAQNATESEIVTGTTSAASGITLPAESVTVLESQQSPARG